MPYLFVLILAIAVTFSNELTTRQGHGVFSWIFECYGLFILNLLFHAGVYMIMVGATASFPVACSLCVLLFLALTNISFFKYAARNEPLYIADLLLFAKIMTVSDISNFGVTRYNISSLILMLGCVVAAVFFPMSAPDVLLRLIFLSVGLVCIVPPAIYIIRSQTNDFTYFVKGFSMGLLANVFLYYTEPLAEPPQPQLERIFVKESPRKPVVTPNVIVLLSESFWNIEKMLSFSEPVTPCFNKLIENFTHGQMIVTPFGGGTCNVESEVLTGAPIRYFNGSTSFYHRYITHPIFALPRIMAQSGYEAHAVHTFDKDFYKRDEAFKCLGFESFKGKEDLADPVYAGSYIADSELTQMIISAFEGKTKPAFIFGVSMENHQPYSKDKFTNNPIKLVGSVITPSLKSIAEVYAHGLNDADLALSELISYFEKVDEPTDILFLGDHLGALGSSFALYRQTGFVNKRGALGLQDIKNLYSTEFALWSNYNHTRNFYPDTSTNFLGNILLNNLGIKKPDMYYFMDEVYEQFHCINRDDLFIDAKGNMTAYAPDTLIKLDRQYRYLARRLILG